MSDSNCIPKDESLDITDIEQLETDESISEFWEEQPKEFLAILVRELCWAKKRIKKLEKKLGIKSKWA